MWTASVHLFSLLFSVGYWVFFAWAEEYLGISFRFGLLGNESGVGTVLPPLDSAPAHRCLLVLA